MTETIAPTSALGDFTTAPAELVLDLGAPATLDVSVAGGKSATLARLIQEGFRVPPGIVIAAGVFRAHLRHARGAGRLIAAIEAAPVAALREPCARLRELLVATPLAEDVEEALRQRLAPLLAGGTVAVRSSATLEDLAGGAFAGQHDTHLDVRGIDATLDAIRRCAASLWEERAVCYRRERGFGTADTAMAVVVQRMVWSEVSGVAFTMDPVAGSLDRIIVSAAFGLGETVVSGDGGVDQFTVLKGSGEVVDRIVGTKAHAVIATGAGSQRVDVDPVRRLAPTLADPQLSAIAELATRVERLHAFPQDIEWAFAGGELHLLQSRPITSFPARWTRDESAERFPNPITPLTWDFTSGGFHDSLPHSLRTLGHPQFAGHWFERFDGYIYGNQTAVELFARAQRVHVESLEALRARKEDWIRRYRWVQELPTAWGRDLDRYLLTLGRLRAVRLEMLDDATMWEHLLAIDALGREYFRPNIAISITQATLHRTLFELIRLLVGGDQAPVMYDRLTCFCDTMTNLVNADLYRLLSVLREDEALLRAVVETDRRELWESGVVDANPRFAAAFRRFLDDHGHREVDFDAYIPTWGSQPWVPLEHLRLMAMRDGDADPARREVALRARQSEAEREYLAAAPADLRNIAAELLRLARLYTALDDLEHYQTTRLSPPFRAAVMEIGRRLEERGVLPQADDVFFLRRRTLTALMEGDADRLDVRPADEARWNRAEYDAAKLRTPPRVWGEETPPSGDGSALRGIPGSAGVAEGAVCRVFGPDDFSRFTPGAVLVARTTNPAWTPLFYSAAAVVTESGGPLSHGAITAREVGVPAVMAVQGALAALADGDRVRVDGSRGLVSRVVAGAGRPTGQ